MSIKEARINAKTKSIMQTPLKIERPRDAQGRLLKASEYYGENLFDYTTSDEIPENIKSELNEVRRGLKKFNKMHAEVVAKAVTRWATQRGATHFTHWFQPLTGGTAEKHDAFLEIKDGKAIEELSVSKLLQGEPDASSFPNGGCRSTFEARGYTSWDISSPMFLSESINGKTLCIPTAFVTYSGDALDIKTPLLRSLSRIDQVATRFLHLCGKKDTQHVGVNAGCEQEYFLVDKSFYFSRPDLVMSGRTLFGSLSAKNQQLEDHYFGAIDDRVLAFMQDLDLQLHRLGIAAKTRHNEVAPGQFEIAPIFAEANVAADQNQIMMGVLSSLANKHGFMVLLHEKPFAGMNGSGKHVNWSMSDNTGLNLLDPGHEPHQNQRFLAVVAIICEAIKRHGAALRMGIASAGNDHRLGANEAPPSIISVFLGDTLDNIYRSILDGKTFTPTGNNVLDLGATQLAELLKDNTDRNRTSPFAFTGNKFELRAVGSKAAVGFPMSILNAAVSEVMDESNQILEKDLAAGKPLGEALLALTKKWIASSIDVVFNGDGYGQEWLEEAQRRGLPNHRTTPEALQVLNDPKQMDFLIKQKVFREVELKTRFNVLQERYIKMREIEFNTLVSMVYQNVLPSTFEYKRILSEIILRDKQMGMENHVETAIYKKISTIVKHLYALTNDLETAVHSLHEIEDAAMITAQQFMPMAQRIAEGCNQLEEIIPNDLWSLPKYYDMLFLR